jgi:phage FluMu gp28-like protein
MPAILPSLKIDRDADLSRYFLGHQVTWILDDSRMRLAEKSVRIGWTWADAFKNVRKRLHHRGRDYLFATKDQMSAIEYVDTCYKFCEIYKYTKTIKDHGVDAMKVPVFRDGKDSGFTEEVKVGYIKFDNGSRILAFSSNPNAMRVFGGDVGLDEFAYHPAPELLWETAQGRITWGYDIGVWSSHNGNGTMFVTFVNDAKAGVGGWSYYRVTMEDAVDMGLLDKINVMSAKQWTKEEFMADCRVRARTEEIFQQAYMCNPSGSSSAIVAWQQIELCRQPYTIERVHFEAEKVVETFGIYRKEDAANRQKKIRDYIRQAFAKHFARTARNRLGFDVAASGLGDLAAIYIDNKVSDLLMLQALFTCRTEDWDFIKNVLWTFLELSSDIFGAGDETGLGRQICWETVQQFPGQFIGVNFASEKHDMGFGLMNQLQVAEKQWSREDADIAADYFAIQKTYHGKKWIFTAGKNAHNPASHCDIAWAGGLSSRADLEAKTSYGAIVI